MKIIILAAGIGSRLGNPFPKPLTPLKNGKSIMKMQVENMTSRYDVDDINVVVGFKKDLIMERFPELTYVYNPFFDQTNTSKSLLRALKKYKDKSVLWINGDVVFDKHIFDKLQPLITAKISFVAVNTNKVGEEEVKYVLKDGYINQLSKTVKNGAGEAVGINFISSDDIPIFINRLEECDNNDYFERGLELAINKDDLKIKAVDISQYNCMEIDFIEDLENANNML
ncbi:MAG: phosphocholine cytidylyltransferase family protein [Flavobacteriaceae bacterium]|jgi:L-glutamine-phosphate cytidylyltransferase|nr:UDP-N-acetylglucosamine pyrophosphorylase [Flavobacteriaceae bacterium]MCP4802631.1 phosphocholine cytidylyltransferase family protein [Bacteroidota bacterium]MDC0956554.1 phosphocholine cytidylyltransferase family protein [Flavobacteriaceae bacterium]MDG1379170.1 phosphocholine cytidylyltransferase family protein [Flavobacteriaceae bacterium]|tara:strand:+ start:114 stop:794 length:681 start_codon:yes stop_codon:yes gene_type:complete